MLEGLIDTMFHHNVFYRLLSRAIANAYVMDGAGGAGVPAQSAPLPITAPPPSVASVVAGATDGLVRDVTPFNAVHSIEPANATASSPGTLTSPALGSFALFSKPGITNLCAGRLSAEVITDLTVTLTYRVSTSASLISASGWIAMRQDPPGTEPAAPGSVAQVATLPGAVPVSINMTGTQQSLLSRAPAIHYNVLVAPILGRPPRIYFAIDHVGLSALTVTLSGGLHVSGMGQVPFS
jgi:hypothetical protein